MQLQATLQQQIAKAATAAASNISSKHQQATIAACSSTNS